MEASDSKERKEARRDSSSEKSRERRSDDRGSRKEEKSERPRDTDRRERREERSDRSRKDDERTDERRPKKYEDDDYEGPNKLVLFRLISPKNAEFEVFVLASALYLQFLRIHVYILIKRKHYKTSIYFYFCWKLSYVCAHFHVE